MNPGAPVDDRHVSRALGTSALLRAADRAINVVWHAAGESRAAKILGRPTRGWQGFVARERSTLVGVALATAAATHLAVTVAHETPAGWLWLVPPGIAVTIAVVLLMWPRTEVN